MVPWDDDIDFSVLRQDYEPLIEYMKSKYIMVDASEWTMQESGLIDSLNKYKNQIFFIRDITGLKCFKGTPEEYVIFDIDAIDFYNDNHNLKSLREYIEKIKHETKKCVQYKDYWNLYQKEISQNTDIVKESNVIAPGVDSFPFHNYSLKDILNKEDMFPLKKIKYEDTEFWAPNNSDKYLKSLYGDYMKPVIFYLGEHYRAMYNKEPY